MSSTALSVKPNPVRHASPPQRFRPVSRPTDPTARPTHPPVLRTGLTVRPTIRLTRRGRAVVVLFVVLAALCLFAARGGPADSTGVVHHPKTSSVVVAPGETVWDIARRAAPDSDPRQVVAEIENLNSLTDPGAIRVGQPLFVPVG